MVPWVERVEPILLSVSFQLKLETFPEIPVKYWRHPSGARAGEKHENWEILILHLRVNPTPPVIATCQDKDNWRLNFLFCLIKNIFYIRFSNLTQAAEECLKHETICTAIKWKIICVLLIRYIRFCMQEMWSSSKMSIICSRKQHTIFLSWCFQKANLTY